MAGTFAAGAGGDFEPLFPPPQPVRPIESASTEIVDFDEGAGTDLANGGGHVPAVFWGPNVSAGYLQNSKTVYQHESMPATIMAALGLTNPPGAAATAPTMGEFFKK